MNKQYLCACFNEQLYFLQDHTKQEKKNVAFKTIDRQYRTTITNYGMYIGRDLGHL